MTNKIQRVEVVDSLRGFALVGIFLLHSIEHFMFFVYPSRGEAMTLFNEALHNATYFLFSGKSYAIFSLLFGFTYYIQHTNQKNKGGDFSWRFLWRMFLLFWLGILNSSFFAADMLVSFSIAALVLIPFRNASARTTLIAAIFFLLQPLELLHVLGVITLPRVNTGELLNFVIEVIKQGNLAQTIYTHATTGVLSSLTWVFDYGRASQIPGLFLLGLTLGKANVFNRSNDFFIKTLLSAVAVTVVMFCASKSMSGSPLFSMWYSLSLAVVMFCSYNLLYRYDYFKKLVQPLSYYGRMSLTNYISQPIICSFIYYPYGLSLAEHMGTTASFALGLVLIVLQINFSKYWLTKYKKGPLEALWHKATWI